MDCKQVSDKLQEYFDGELSPEVAQQVESALVDCPECQSELESYNQIREVLRGPIEAELAAVNLDGLWEGIQKEIGAPSVDTAVSEEAPGSAGSWWKALTGGWTQRQWIPIGGALVAAALIGIVAGPQLFESEQTRPTPEPKVAVLTGEQPAPTEPSKEVIPPMDVSNLAFVSAVQYESGTVLIDQNPQDPTEPLIVWHITDELEPMPQGG